MSLSEISHVAVHRKAIDQTMVHLRSAAKLGCEGIALWVGERFGTKFVVGQSYIPKQYGVQADTGLIAYVDDQALHELGVWLYERRLELVAQIHSHPAEAYHSDTDDGFAIATRDGAFSVVVPNFAFAPFAFADCAIYRLHDDHWLSVPEHAVAQLFSVQD